MIYIFDLDDTLVATQFAVLAAYKAAGVIMPDGAWGRPSKSWLQDTAKHARKNEMYPGMLKLFAKPLPMLDVACALAVDHDVRILTAASMAALVAVREAFPLIASLSVEDYGCTADEKVAKLKSITEGGIYFDDNSRITHYINETLAPTWRAVCACSH